MRFSSYIMSSWCENHVDCDAMPMVKYQRSVISSPSTHSFQTLQLEVESLVVGSTLFFSERSFIFSPYQLAFHGTVINDDGHRAINSAIVVIPTKDVFHIWYARLATEEHILLISLTSKCKTQLTNYLSVHFSSFDSVDIALTFCASTSQMLVHYLRNLKLNVTEIPVSAVFSRISKITHLLFFRIVGFDLNKKIQDNRVDLRKDIFESGCTSSKNNFEELTILSSDDDDNDKLIDIRVPLPDGSFRILSLSSTRKCLEPLAWINDELVNFYLEDYLSKFCLSSKLQGQIHIHNTFLFKKLYNFRSELTQEQNSTSPGYWLELCNKLYMSKRGRLILPTFDKELLVIPVFWVNHWLLVLIHGVKRLIFNPEVEATISDDGLSDLLDPIKSTCRVMIIDSKMHDKLNEIILPRIHAEIFNIIKGWLRMMILAKHDSYTAFITRYSQHRCQSLPDQLNQSDCGLFMLRFAERFVIEDRSWMDLPYTILEEITVGESDEDFIAKVNGMKDHIRHLIQNMTEMDLNI